MEEKKIIQSTRTALGLSADGTDFNDELIMHIDAALNILNQNGIGVENLAITTATTWAQFKNPLQVYGNLVFRLIPPYVFFKTKILFDPPPPSNVAFYNSHGEELLWRLRMGYERDNPILYPEVIVEEV